MTTLLTHPGYAVAAGLALCGLALIAGWSASRLDSLTLISFLLRFVHVGAVVVWVGMIWFVNFVQLAALRDADEGARATLIRQVALPVARLFRMASHVTLASGAGLLLTSGYLLDRWVFPSAVYIPTARGGAIWLGALAGVAMWWLVHWVIWPSLAVVADASASAEVKAAARQRILLAARTNLALAMPATLLMVAAAHLY